MSARESELLDTTRGRSRGRIDLLAFAISPDERWAVTLLRVRDTGYWLESLYEYSADGWIEHSTTNGVIAWNSISFGEADEAIGVLRYYGEAPADADAALVQWRGDVREAPVMHGHFVFADWEAPEPDEYDPKVVGFNDTHGRLVGFQSRWERFRSRFGLQATMPRRVYMEPWWKRAADRLTRHR
jgi:hypothetical protein